MTAPVTALSMMVLLGFTALALDGGILYRERRALQNIADAAALAGARELPGDPIQALLAAEQYVLENGGRLADIEEIALTTRFNPEDAVQVRLRRTVPLFFAPVLGHVQQDVAVAAMGLVTPIEPYDVWPWGVTQESLVYGVELTLKVGSRNNMTGNFMALDFPDSSGASDYEDYIKYGWNGDLPGPVPPNTWTIATETGNIAGKTQKGVDDLLSQPNCTPPWADVRCPRVGIVPVLGAYTWDEVAGKSSVQVVGFATFLLTGITNAPAGQKEVHGVFLEYAYGVGRRSWVGLPLEGLLGVRLWQ
ncbi:MAG: hypothetical protein HY689_12465 [Chloroflexi bacterium]|nr:hypothetical protein [Chloroflexota bacterium]